MLCVTRTPLIPSWRLPFTAEIAVRMRMNVGFACRCQMINAKRSSGNGISAIVESCQSIENITTAITTSMRMSPIVGMLISMNSCSDSVSFWTRDISRPTSLRSKNVVDCACTCANMSLRRS